MKTRELLVIAIIMGYFLIIFSVMVSDKEVERQSSGDMPIQMVEIHGNGTVRNYEIENTSESNILSSIAGTVSHFAFALPFVLGGIGMWGMPLAILNLSTPMLSDNAIQWLSFFIPSLVSIPVTIILSAKIPMWKRIPYIYIFAMLISGTPVLLSGNFGQ